MKSLLIAEKLLLSKLLPKKNHDEKNIYTINNNNFCISK